MNISAAVRSVIREVSDLLLPLACAGCGRYGIKLCDECWLQWQIGAMRVEHLVPAFAVGTHLPLWAAAPYTGAVRQSIIGMKDRGRSDVLELVCGAAARLAQRIGPVLADLARAEQQSIGLVSVPARKPAWLGQREIELPAYFGAQLCDQFRQRGIGAARMEVLRHNRFTRDQVGLDRSARLKNRSGSMRLRSFKRAGNIGGQRVLVVDDVATTGATMRESVRELTRAGAVVLGGVVLAVTPPRNPLHRKREKI